MAKFIKSIFQSPSSEKRNNIRHDAEIEGEGDSPIGDRRKLSMSRSGRLKQAYRKRHSLSLELYGKDDDIIQPMEKPKSKEYHVHPVTSTPEPTDNQRRNVGIAPTVNARNGSISPEEEIDNAFDVIDKS